MPQFLLNKRISESEISVYMYHGTRRIEFKTGVKALLAMCVDIGGEVTGSMRVGFDSALVRLLTGGPVFIHADTEYAFDLQGECHTVQKFMDHFAKEWSKSIHKKKAA